MSKHQYAHQPSCETWSLCLLRMIFEAAELLSCNSFSLLKDFILFSVSVFLPESLGSCPCLNSLTSACSITFLTICGCFLWTFSKSFCIIKQFSLSQDFAVGLYQKDFGSNRRNFWSWVKIKLVDEQESGGGRNRNTGKNEKQSNTL